MTEKRFSIEREVDMFTGRQSAIHLIDEVGDLPRLIFTDPTDLYEWEKAFIEEWTSLKKENEQLKSQLKEIAYYFRDGVTRNDLDDKDFEDLKRLVRE